MHWWYEWCAGNNWVARTIVGNRGYERLGFHNQIHPGVLLCNFLSLNLVWVSWVRHIWQKKRANCHSNDIKREVTYFVTNSASQEFHASHSSSSALKLSISCKGQSTLHGWDSWNVSMGKRVWRAPNKVTACVLSFRRVWVWGEGGSMYRHAVPEMKL
jgi:hypothetical protein